MPKKTLTRTKAGIDTKIISRTAIATSIFVLLALIAGFSYGMSIKFTGEKNKAVANNFFQQYIK
ncbi:MAG: hypothetical protein WC663_01210 [Patescibacteria group bacterium]|jgi:hypothetical protein